jgi:hypothetical protein
MDEPANEDSEPGAAPISAAAHERQDEPLTDELLRRLREAGL